VRAGLQPGAPGAAGGGPPAAGAGRASELRGRRAVVGGGGIHRRAPPTAHQSPSPRPLGTAREEAPSETVRLNDPTTRRSPQTPTPQGVCGLTLCHSLPTPFCSLTPDPFLFPGPGEHALAPDHQVLAVRLDRPEERLGFGGQVLLEDGLAPVVQDVGEHGPGVQVYPAVESVRLVVGHVMPSRVTGRPDPASWLGRSNLP